MWFVQTKQTDRHEVHRRYTVTVTYKSTVFFNIFPQVAETIKKDTNIIVGSFPNLYLVS